MRTIFYVDGFNLYMARLKHNRQFRWLNLGELARIIATRDDSAAKIEHVNFYTAYVSGKIDPDAVRKQQAYLAALKSTPLVSVHTGNFVISERWVKVSHPPLSKPDGYTWNEPYPEFIKAHIPQEKGSDVKLGVHLVRDSYENRFDRAYVITSDTDLVEPIRIATEELGKDVVIVPPIKFKPSSQPIAPSLIRVASSHCFLEDLDFTLCQFPDTVNRLHKSSISKPLDWIAIGV